MNYHSLQVCVENLVFIPTEGIKKQQQHLDAYALSHQNSTYCWESDEFQALKLIEDAGPSTEQSYQA